MPRILLSTVLILAVAHFLGFKGFTQPWNLLPDSGKPWPQGINNWIVVKAWPHISFSYMSTSDALNNCHFGERMKGSDKYNIRIYVYNMYHWYSLIFTGIHWYSLIFIDIHISISVYRFCGIPKIIKNSEPSRGSVLPPSHVMFVLPTYSVFSGKNRRRWKLSIVSPATTSHCKRHIQHPPGSSCRAFQKALWFMVCLPGSPSDQHRQLHGEARGNFPSTLLVEPTNHSVLQLSLSHLHK